jgi:hypothetical protein
MRREKPAAVIVENFDLFYAKACVCDIKDNVWLC